MTLGQSIQTVYSKYVTFSGRASRSEFWWFHLFYVVIVGLPISFISETLDNIWSAINFLPAIAVACRRLHDIDRSGWWQVLPLAGLPLILIEILDGGFAADWFSSPLFLIGAAISAVLYILLIVWYATDSTPGENRFGPHPAGTADAEIFD